MLAKRTREQKRCWVRPVLAENTDEPESDYNIDALGELVRGPKAGLTLNEDQDEEDDEEGYPDEDEEDSASPEDDDNGSGGNRAAGDGSDPAWPLEVGGGVGQNDSAMSQTFVSHRIPDESPLQLPFSTVGISGARLTNLFAELRKKTDLDLFQVPSGAGNTATSVCNGGGKLFDADALADELERHERTLREFDDFLSDFTSSVVVGLNEAVGPVAGLRPGGVGGGSALRQVQPTYEEDIGNMGDLY
ncbi:unnamed protein product [Schistocephalus solidus]|uniref:Condensin complex subunit 2 n=1 Tax=Schistocephalus solidus TaxID=70667 RepID=A0A183TPB9_SCHSO|nr:unnamed protein product [Schistocephalus solidus]